MRLGLPRPSRSLPRSLPPQSSLRRSKQDQHGPQRSREKMAQPAHGAHDADHHADYHDHGAPSFWRRWFYSTNHKDIGTLYLIFSFTAGLLGGFPSFSRRARLPEPRLQFFS